MAFLVDLGKIVLDFFLGKLLALAKQKYADYQAKKAIEKAAEDSVAKLQAAKTAEEIDAAAKDTLNHL